MMIWSAMKFPDGFRSFAGLRICGASPVSDGIIPSVVPTWHTFPSKAPQSSGSVSQGR